jgi:hypothetical protein
MSIFMTGVTLEGELLVVYIVVYKSIHLRLIVLLLTCLFPDLPEHKFLHMPVDPLVVWHNRYNFSECFLYCGRFHLSNNDMGGSET